MMKRISITGSSGFLGQHLIESFKKNKFYVNTISRKDLALDTKKLSKKIKKQSPNFFIHLASHTSPDVKSETSFAEQIDNTLKIAIKTAFSIPEDIALAIYFGSIEEYGSSEAPFEEHNTPSPNGSYGWAKYSSYIAIKSILNERNIPFIWVRPSLVYGIGASKKRLIGQILDAYKNKKKLRITNPSTKRDFLYVSDLCDIIIKILKKPKTFNNILLNVSSANYLTVEEFARLFNVEIIKKNPPSNSSEQDLLNSNKQLKNKFKNLEFTNIKKAIENIKNSFTN